MSLLLSIFYLTKDMLNRWKTHFSGALARICVVFLLTIIALIVLSSFVVSEKVVAAEIHRNGGNVVSVVENYFGNTLDGNEKPPLPRDWISAPAGTVISTFDETFSFAKYQSENFPIVLYDFSAAHFFPEIKFSPKGVFFLPKSQSEAVEAFRDFEVSDYIVPAKTLARKRGNEVLSAIYPAGAVFVPANSGEFLKNDGFTRRTIFEASEANAEIVRMIEQGLRERIRLDERRAFVFSSLKLLERMERIRQDQQVWRWAIPLGIIFIIGILLISISSVEFRQNEYIYALMNSFGVNRALLVASFVVENAILIFGAFFAAVRIFFRCLPLLIQEAFKLGGNITLSMQELSSDFTSIIGSLLVCIVLSAVPVALSAFREIGKVLK